MVYVDVRTGSRYALCYSVPAFLCFLGSRPFSFHPALPFRSRFFSVYRLSAQYASRLTSTGEREERSASDRDVIGTVERVAVQQRGEVFTKRGSTWCCLSL